MVAMGMCTHDHLKVIYAFPLEIISHGERALNAIGNTDNKIVLNILPLSDNIITHFNITHYENGVPYHARGIGEREIPAKIILSPEALKS